MYILFAYALIVVPDSALMRFFAAEPRRWCESLMPVMADLFDHCPVPSPES